MKKLILLLFFLLTSLIVKTQEIPGEGLVVVEFNAPFSNSSCEYLDKLKDCDIAKVDISKDPKIGPKHKIVVIPTLVIFKDGEEVARFQADLSFKMVATKEEVQEEIDNQLMSDF